MTVAGSPAQIIALFAERGLSLAVAESLTGGLLAAAITDVPGASEVFRGGVVAYASDLKTALLGVPADLLARHGAVDPGVAQAMAQGAREQLGASVAVATTGVAGPGPAEGKAPGTVHIAVSTAGDCVTRTLALAGGRNEVRRATVEECLSLLWSTMADQLR
ncbi:MAG TPA: CinA family protein [Streptosporangiaceae bacterium]|nr:CinA family protein [Streptosporangiaceae bacterium]